MTLALVTQAPGACAKEPASLVVRPVAMAIAQSVGGLPGLTAVIGVFTGIVGYAFWPALLDRAGVRDPASRGIAHGAVAPIVVAARAAHRRERAGLPAGLVMALHALLLALLMPILMPWLLAWIGARHGHG